MCCFISHSRFGLLHDLLDSRTDGHVCLSGDYVESDSEVESATGR